MRSRGWLMSILVLIGCPKKDTAPDAAPAAVEAPKDEPVRRTWTFTQPAVKPSRPLYYEREITNADLEGRSIRELTLLRNWIYARTGNVFFKQWLHDFFEAEPWYKPTGLDESKLSAMDKKNTELISAYEIALSKAELEKRRNELIAKHEYVTRDPADALAVSPDGKFVASGKWSLNLWDAATGRELKELEAAQKVSPDEDEENPPSGFVAIGFSPDSKKVAAAKYDGHIFVYEVASGKKLASIEIPEAEREAFITRGDPWRAYVPQGDGEAIVDLAAGKLLADRVEMNVPFALSADSKVAIIYAANTVAVHDVEKKTLVRSIEVGAMSNALAIGADGKRGLAITNNNRLHVLDVEKGTVVRSFFTGNGAISLELSPDGKLAAVTEGLGQDRIEVWDVETGKALWVYEGVTGPAIFTPDGKRVIAGGPIMRAYEVATGAPIAAWAGREPLPTEDVAIELQLLSRSLGVSSPVGDESSRSPLDDPHLLDELISVDRLKDLSRRDLRLIRNMIFARRGRPFKTESVRDYFERMEWYQADPQYSDKRLSKIDHENIKIVLSVEKERGGPMREDEQMRMEMA